jgi:hypothetical protein
MTPDATGPEVSDLINTGFKPVNARMEQPSRFNGLLEYTQRGKALKRLKPFGALCTWLKPGVNDKRPPL